MIPSTLTAAEMAQRPHDLVDSNEHAKVRASGGVYAWGPDGRWHLIRVEAPTPEAPA